MSPSSMLRLASRTRCTASMRAPMAVRYGARTISATTCRSFSASIRAQADIDAHDPHHEESFEDFNARYEKEFDGVQDVFELQRNLNNAFAYDLVPNTNTIAAALRAARRVNDFPTAVRIFEGIKAKVENTKQYDEYLVNLEPLREELGILLKESLYPEEQ